MNERLSKEQMQLLENFYSSQEAEFIVDHIINYQKPNAERSLEIALERAESLLKILFIEIIVFAVILIFIAMKAFLHV